MKRREIAWTMFGVAGCLIGLAIGAPRVDAAILADIYAVASTATPSVIDRRQETGTEIIDSGWLQGIGGNSAQFQMVVSLDHAYIATYLAGDSGEIGVDPAGWSSLASQTDFTERLIFSVPAGDYPAGVTATLTGRIRGILQPMKTSTTTSASA